VSDRPNPTLNRQATKRLRRWRNRLARRLLDKAFAEYLRGLAPRDDNQSNSSISVPSPPPSPPSQLPSPSPNQVLSYPRSPTLPLIEPDSPHSALTSRICPDSPPPSIRSFVLPSYSPIHSPEEPPRPSSPASSTTSSIHWRSPYPSSSTHISLLLLRSSTILKYSDPSISAAHHFPSSRLLFHQTRRFRSIRNQVNHLGSGSKHNHFRLSSHFPVSLWSSCSFFL